MSTLVKNSSNMKHATKGFHSVDMSWLVHVPTMVIYSSNVKCVVNSPLLVHLLTDTHIHRAKDVIKVSPDLAFFWLTLASTLVINLSNMKLYNISYVV
jgi:hypothetical protein